MSNFSLKDNVGLIVVLRARPQGSAAPGSIQDSPAIAIANTHLIFNPKRGDIKVPSKIDFKGTTLMLETKYPQSVVSGIIFPRLAADSIMLGRNIQQEHSQN